MVRSAPRHAARLGGLALAFCLPLVALAQGTAFREDFDRLDTDRWYISDGWTNGDWQSCTWSREMVETQDGLLRLTISPPQDAEGGEMCGEIQTNATFLYGTYEARLRTDAASGVNAAFFTFIGPVHEKPHNEIDVEVLARDTRQVQFTIHMEGESSRATTMPLPGQASADERFHTYSFTWEPDRLRWYVDGQLMLEETAAPLPQIAQKIYISHWTTRTLTDWMGAFEDPGRPLVMEVDWVSYTPPGAGCRFEGSVLCIEDEPK